MIAKVFLTHNFPFDNTKQTIFSEALVSLEGKENFKIWKCFKLEENRTVNCFSTFSRELHENHKFCVKIQCKNIAPIFFFRNIFTSILVRY